MISRRDFIKGIITTGVTTWLLGNNKQLVHGKELLLRENEYEIKMKWTMQSVRSQLETQGKLSLLPIYERIIKTKASREMEERYCISVMGEYMNLADTTIQLPSGGVIGYNGFGGTTVVDTYMDHDTTVAYVTGVNASIQASAVVSAFLNMIPNWGSAFGFLLALTTYANNSAVQSVHNAGDYGYIMSVSHPIEGTATVLMGWNQYPTAIIPWDATNVHVEDFSIG